MKRMNLTRRIASVATILIALIFISENTLAQGTAPVDSDGDGRLEISTKEHLLFLSENLSDADMSADYEQVNNIYFTDSDFQYGGDFYNDGKGFRPIKAPTGLLTIFYGSYDGQGFIIDGLYINRPSSNSVGFFADATGYVKNLGLTNVQISGGDQVGSINGYSTMTIINCYATGTVHGSDFVGGLVGEGKDQEGVTGEISNSYFIGNVSGDERVGGLVGDFRGEGYQNNGVILRCYSQGSVSGNKNVGGFAGYIKYVDIEQSYSTSSVSGNEDVGGFVGSNYHYGNYNVTNSFWNTQTSGQSSSDGATGKTTSEMKNIRTYTDVGWSNGLSDAWDFMTNPYDDNSNTNIWDIDASWNNGYPFYANGLKPEDTDGDGKLEISQVEHLQYLSESPKADLSADYEQMNDISFTSAQFQSDATLYNYGNFFNPIGDAENPFTGSYDGQEYSIDGIKINRQDSDNIGLYGVVSGAVIKNLTLENTEFVGRNQTGAFAGTLQNNSILENCESISGSIEGGNQVGGLTGTADNSTLENCVATYGSVEGADQVGGMAGTAENSSIKECNSTIFHINSNGNYIGGLVGSLHNSLCESNKVNSSNVTGHHQVGGIAGLSLNSTIIECDTDVDNLKGTGDNVGGLVGTNDNSTIKKSYSRGKVTGLNFTTGGLVGWNKNGSEVENSFSQCWVIGNKKVGGLVAVNEGSTVSFCYASAMYSYHWPPTGNSNVGGLIGISYNGTTTNSFYLSNAGSPLDSDGGTGKTIDELQDVATYTDVNASDGLSAPWDFINNPNDDTADENHWALIDGLNSNYPLLFSGEGSQPVDNDGDGLLEIANRQDLLFLSQNPLADWTADYEQIADIAFDPGDFEPGGDFYNGGQGFRPIGSDADYFRGDYNGQGYSISGLTINRPSSEQVGMFGALFFSTIEDINLSNVDIAGKKMVGALAGKAWRGELKNVSVQGAVNANEEQVGGLVGLSDKSDFNSCETDVTVSGLSKVGGLAGEINSESTIEGCSVQGTISANEDLAGGLAGLVDESTITASESDVDVSALSAAGGIAGKGYFATIEEAFAQGTISADEDQAGGIIGWSYENEIISCESDVEVSASTEAGGIAGLNYKGIINSCETNVDVSATTKAGGITGYNNRGTIENTSAYGIISAEEEQAGGIAGLSDFGDITRCEVDVNVSGFSKTGGIAGEFKNGSIINSLAQGTISADDEYAGGLTGLTSGSQIISCFSDVNVNGRSKVGGISGSVRLYSSKILKTTAQGTVTATEALAGGLVGISEQNVQIIYCEADVGVTATSQAGGLVGKNQSSTIMTSSAKGNVICSDSLAGGLIGYNTLYSTVENCYAIGNVEGDSKVGGLIGSNEYNVLKSYSIGTVTGNTNAGGLIGHINGGSVSDAFWDTETSGITISAGGTGKTTAEMKDVVTYTGLVTNGLSTSWDFVSNPNDDLQNDDIWTMIPDENQGYPSFFSPGEEPTDSDGDGIVEIYTKQHLLYLSKNPLADWSLNYKQMNDITFSSDDFQEGGDFYEGGAGFSPIGNNNDKFSGTYDGNDYEIAGLYINRPGQTHTGFFGFVEEATISHLHIADADIAGNSNTGILIGEQNNSDVKYCSTSGEIVVNDANAEHVGGLIGKSQSLDMNNPRHVTRCHADVTITSSAKAVGGLIGYSRASIDFSFALGNVSGKSEVGGLIGYNYIYNITLQNCYARVDVTATLSHAGGLVGKNYSTDINDCYATGSVSGTNQHLGGLIGENTGGFYPGTGDISNCFWDTETSGQTASDGGTGKTTAEMKDVATYTDLSTQGLDWPDTWDFVGDPNHDDENNSWWNIAPSENDGYPVFYSPGAPLEDSDNDGRLEIYTKADLLYLSVNPEADLSLDYEQMNDIQFVESDFEEGGDFYFYGEGFIPIGRADSYGRFTGTYDGQGYVIDKLYMNRSMGYDLGLFEKIYDGLVENLGLTNVNISGNSNVGAFAGQVSNGGAVHKCFITGSISGNNSVGGITGGASEGALISENYSNAGITGENRIGGIVGQSNNSSSTDTVTIKNCYSVSSVTANKEMYPYAGGIAAYLNGKVKVENCFAAGMVSGNDTYIGGAIGLANNVLIKNVFWDTETSGQDASNGGTGKTSAEMKELLSFTDTNTEGLDEAWDFVDNPNDDSSDEDIWTMEFSGAANSGYPYLAWQEVPETAPEIETLQAMDIAATSAIAKGNILSTGNPMASQHGVIWNNTGSPTFDDNKTEEDVANENGEFSSELTSLMPNRTYYYKAYAINDQDTVIGDEVSFTTAKKELALAGTFAVDDKVYDGSLGAAISNNSLTLQGVEGNDMVTLESVTAQFDAANAGSAILVNITNASLGGSHSENYTLGLEDSPTTTASIAGKELTVTADNKEREQCAENPDFTFVFSGFVNSEDESVLTTEPTASCPADASTIAGEYEITLSGGEDENYNFNYVGGTLTILEDTTAPVAVTQDLTLELNDSGEAVINADQVDNGSTDNCSIDEMIVFPSTFNCAHIGENTVTLTVEDAAGNESSSTAVITIEDNQSPSVITEDISVSLNAGGEASITTADIDNGSSDNCSFETFELDITEFDCSDIGENVVTLTAVDPSGNTASQTATVTVVDDMAPEVVTQNITVELNASGYAAITADDIDNGSLDNCAIDSYQLDISNFDCSNVGENVVTLTVTDVNGNTAEGTAEVTIQDNISPTLVTQDITVELGISGMVTISVDDVDNGSYDNCSIATRYLDATTFGCADVGDNTVTLTVTDVNGNEAQQTAIVTVEDNLAPTVITKDITVELNNEGEASITPADIDNGSSDNCSIETYELDVTEFNCSNVGENVVTITVVDSSGNTASQNAIVTVVDVTTPEVLTQNVTVELDATGQAEITTADIDNGSTDNCSIDSYQLDVSNFDCSNIGENLVTLTVTDVNGNEAQATAIVSVQDNMAPTVITQDFAAELDISGMTTISVDDVDNGSYDNCSIATRQLDVTSFGCEDVGDNTVTLTVTDVNGNEAHQTAIVTVEDNIGPTVITQDTLIELNPDGEANVTPLEIDNGSVDNCAVDTYELDQTFFDESHIGENIVTLTVTDVHGNATFETAIVTIADNTPPTIISQPVTLYLDMNGEATLTPEEVDNGSYDNVEITSMEIDLNYFACDDTGEHTVTLTATDISGNSTSATETVTVLDTITPSGLQVNSMPMLCYGINEAQIEIVPVGGFGQMAFSINNGATWQQGDGLFSGLSAGTYNIVVESANGCLVYHDDNPIVFEEPVELVINELEVTDATCNGAANGMIDVEAAGGTGLHYFSADGGVTWQEGHLLYGLPAGSYEVLVMDDNGCVTPYAQNPVIINEPEALVYEQVLTTDVTCNGSASGAIEISASGGTGTIEYSIGDGFWQTDGLFEDLEAGEYELRIRDDRNCLNIYDDNPVMLNEPEALVIEEVIAIDINCFGGNDGSIELTSSGGAGAHQYSIDEGAEWQSDNTFTALEPGSYSIMVKDENECVTIYANNPVAIEQPEELIINQVTTEDLSCFGSDDGQIIIDAGGGTGALEYSLDGQWQTESMFSSLAPGEYEVEVKDENECLTTYSQNPVTINEPEAIAVSILASADTAMVDETITLTAECNYADAECYWAPLGIYGEQVEVSEDLVGEYEYTVTTTNSNGCEATAMKVLVFTINTSVEGVDQTAEIIVMPNPTDGKFKVKAKGMWAAYTLQIFSSNGSLVDAKSKIPPQKRLSEFDLTNHPSGIYYLKVSCERSQWTQKIILRH